MIEVGGVSVVRLAPSFRAFVGAREGASLNDVLHEARRLAGAALDVAAVDIPLARGPIAARRESDSQVSRLYGGRGCAVHSPTAERPGPLATVFRDALASHGLPLVTQRSDGAVTPAALVVYPHVLLLHLLDAKYRVPYKVSRTRAYWPEENAPSEGISRRRTSP